MSFKKIICLMICALTLTSLLPLASFAAFTGSDRVVIVLDPGHGGPNIGAAANGTGEKVFTLRLATLIKQHLDSNGSFVVYMTRTGDYDLELCERSIYANEVNADALISLHFDGSTDTSQKGVTVYTSVFDQYALTSLGSSISSAVASSVGLSSNGVRRKADTSGYYWNAERQWDIKDPSLGTLSDYYGIPTWAAKFGIRSLIVEHGYTSNAHDREIICASGTLEKMAKAEADAIIAYYTNHTHTYGAAVRDYPSCCTFQGKQSEHCTVCGHRRNIQSLPAAPDNHYWESTVTVPATCGKDGSVTRKCRITENLIEKGYKNIQTHTVTEVIPAPTQHSYVMVENVEPTHTVDGYQKFSCSTCGNTFREVIAAEGHNFEYVSYTAPTCTADGGALYRCTGCSAERTDREAAPGHKYTVSDETPATCTEAGSKTSKCDVCDDIKKEEFAPFGHDTSGCQRLEPTCTENGSLKGVCATCGEDIDEVIEASGHTYEKTVIKEATCTEGGEVIEKCSVCNDEKNEATDPLGHDCLLVSYTAANCEERGLTVFVCSRCSRTFSGTTSAAGHDLVLDHETAPGLFKKGERVYICSNCETYVSEEIKTPVTVHLIYGFAIIAGLALAASLVFLAIVLLRRRRNAFDEVDLIEEIGFMPTPVDIEETVETVEDVETVEK